MKKALLIGGGVIAALVVLLVAVVAMQPAQMHVERSTVIPATPEQVWPHIETLQAFEAWSPWHDLDPDQVIVWSDPPTGVGSYYTWEGDENVGKGKMTVTNLEPPALVEHDLVFVEPFESQARVSMALAPVEGGTNVTWGMTSDNNFVAKAIGLFMDMDDMVGTDFEKGLTRLTGLVEADLAAQEAVPEEDPAEDEGEATAETEEATP